MPNTTNNLAQVLGLRRRVSESNEQTLLRILQGSTCSPMSLKDLQRYLENKTFCRENLDALQWFVSYRSRFNDLPPAEKALSPPPTDFDLTSGVSTHTTSPHNDSFFDSIPTARNLHKVIVDTQSDLSTAPVDAQPFRHEVNAAIKIFFTSGGDSELNIPGPMRMAIVEHAKHTTHPCVFAPAARHCFDIISSSSIPAFTKHAAENIQTVSRLERLGVAIILFLLGFIAAFCLIYFDINRWARIAVFPFIAGSTGFVYTFQSKVCLWKAQSQEREVFVEDTGIVDAETGNSGKEEYAAWDRPKGNKRYRVVSVEVKEPLVLDQQDHVRRVTVGLSAALGVVVTAVVVAIPHH